ncbi:profilin [Xylona heveae TC161]|uniref:Profilin n=1 Tax=Xylona heveae (strain CBS 132557 / TC161) TaxID=1328760 RepID=A0A165FP57_XYLHT|nr:profilin [Xylona heveae TC161]KZF21216.1 profilin [Xylona heveae TC161]
MSWQAYVDTSLLQSGNVDKAAIYKVDGSQVWAASAGFSVAPAEMTEVVNAYKDSSQVFANGLHVAGERYVVIKADDRSLYGKKGKEGLVIVKTKQTLLFTHYPEGVNPGSAANTVEVLADYLIGVGY